MNKKRIKIVQWLNRFISAEHRPEHFTKDKWLKYYHKYVKYYE